MAFHVYILKCRDGFYYVGHTDDVEKRISEHMQGLCSYTSRRLPVETVFAEDFGTRVKALEMERRIKKWSRNKKEALIDGDWELISSLARKNFDK